MWCNIRVSFIVCMQALRKKLENAEAAEMLLICLLI